MVWRIGVALREIPQPPACVGVAPQGLNLGSVQPLPQLILGTLRDSTCLVKCLRGLVRAAVTAPNAPKSLAAAVDFAAVDFHLFEQEDLFSAPSSQRLGA